MIVYVTEEMLLSLAAGTSDKDFIIKMEQGTGGHD